MPRLIFEPPLFNRRFLTAKGAKQSRMRANKQPQRKNLLKLRLPPTRGMARPLSLVFDNLFDNLGDGSIDQLDVGHRCIVATTTSTLQDAQVTARALEIAWAKISK